MKRGTSFVTLLILLLSFQTSLAQMNVCERIFDHKPLGDEYLPFPLIDEFFIDKELSTLASFYSPEAGLSFEISHLMGAEYLVKMTQDWNDRVNLGVVVYSEGSFSGFVQYRGAHVLLDLGAITENGQNQYYIQLDGRCFRAEIDSPKLP